MRDWFKVTQLSKSTAEMKTRDFYLFVLRIPFPSTPRSRTDGCHPTGPGGGASSHCPEQSSGTGSLPAFCVFWVCVRSP